MKILLLIFSFFVASLANATNYYFSSTTGDDSRSASQAQNSATPWKTLSKLNSIFSTLAAGDNVYFQRGDIFPGNIVVSKSGSSSSPITLSAFGSGADPVISGFTTIAAWTSLGSNLWESTNAASTLSTCNALSVAGANYAKGRTPDAGYWTIASTNGSTTITDATHLNASTTNWTGAEVVVRELMFQVNRHNITAASGSMITFGAGSIPAGWGYFIQNDKRACNLQNEWAYSSSTKKITIYSTSSPVNVKVASVEEAVNLGSKDYIVFDNLDFQGYNTTGINTTSRSGLKIQNCEFSFIGTNAIYAYPNSSGIKITGNTFTDIGSRAIHAGSSANALISGNTLSRIGHFAGMGSSSDDSFTGIISNGDYSEVSYNNLTNIGYCGIRWDGNGTVIKGNYINTTNYIKDDGGGIYCFMAQYGNSAGHTLVQRTVRDNIVLNSVGAPEGSIYGKQGMGIYMDAQSPNVNVIHNTVSGGFLGIFVNGGHDIVCDSNTTYNLMGGYYIYKESGPLDNEKVTNNIFVATTGVASCGSGQYAANYKFGSSGVPSSFVASKNVYARPLDQNNGWIFSVLASNACNTLAQWQSVTGKDAGSTGSPVTTTNAGDLRLEYNETSSTKTISLGATYKDMRGVSYPGTITLNPFSSAVLIKTGAAANVSPAANAGADINISLPTVIATLSGSGTDPDGTIASYSWTKISGPTGTITNLASAITTVTGLLQGTYVFQLKVTDNAGATATDNVQVTVNAAGNTAPTANAGTDQAITLPTSTITLAGSGTDPNGTIASYAWTKTSGTGGAITNPAAASTTVTGLAAGTYVFQLKVTDNGGAIATDDIIVTVNAAGTGQKIINVNVYGGTNPYSNTQWNNWSPTVNTASSNYKYADGTQSTVNGKLTGQTSIIDNGSTYAPTATVCPPAVLRYNSVHNAQRKLTVSGLSASKKYTFTFYASSTVTTQGTSYLIGSVSNDIMTYNNIKAASIVNVVPNSSGVVDVKLLSIYTYNNIAGFTITEQAGTVAGRSSIQQSEEPDAITPEQLETETKMEIIPAEEIVNIFPNPFVNSVQLQLNGQQTGMYYLSLYDISGKIMWKKSVSKNGGSLVETINTMSLRGGMYILEIISPDQKRTTHKIVKVN